VGGGVAAKVAVGLAAVAVAGGAGYEGVTSVESAPRLANPAAQAAERAVAVTSLPTPRVATASRRAVPMPAPVVAPAVAPEARVSKPKPKSVAGKSKPERVGRVEAAAPLTKAHLEPVRVSRPTKSRTSGTPEQHAKPVKERKVIPIRRKSAALPVEKVAPVRGKSATAPGRVDVKEQKPAPR
jgi:hypothetical protein